MAKISKVSLVEVSPSMVTALKVLSTAGVERSAQRPRLDRRVGEEKDQQGRHVGRDHAGALGDAVDGDGDAVDLRFSRGELGKGVGGHDGARRIGVGVRLGLAHQRAKLLDDLAGIERLADHPGRSDIDVGLEAVGGPRRGFGGQRHRLLAALAGEGIGVAGIDHERAGHAVREMRAAPIDRRRRGLGVGQNAGDRRAGVEQRQQQIDAARVANPRGGCGDAHALDCRQARHRLRRERRDLAQQRPLASAVHPEGVNCCRRAPLTYRPADRPDRRPHPCSRLRPSTS